MPKKPKKPHKGTAREENVRVGKKGGGVTPCDPNEAKNAQRTQARMKKRKKYLNTCDARVITTPYSNPRKESNPPPQKHTDSVTATPWTRSLTSGLAESNSWASVALTHCAKPQARWNKPKKYTKHSWRESNHTAVLESKKGIGTLIANAHRVGDSHTAYAEPNSWASVALTHCLTHEWEAKGTAGYLSRTPRARNIRLSPAVYTWLGSRTSDLSQAWLVTRGRETP